MLSDAAIFLAFHHDRVTFHGIRYGKGMKTILVPKYSKGTLITWTEGRTGIAVTEHNTDSIIHIKELFNTDIDKLCHLYLFGYVQIQTEDSWISARISRQPHAQDPQAPRDQQTADETMSSSTSASGQPSDISIEEIHKKREGPVEIVIQAPERKKAKPHLSSLWWMCQRPKKILLPQPHEIWFEELPRWMRRKLRTSTTSTPSRLLLHLHCRTEAHLYIYLLTGEIYRVDEDTDVLGEDRVLENWPDFEESDKAELKQFVDEKVFQKVKLDELPEDVVLVDATWVRKYKRLSSTSLKAKSRLCARGFLDPQKQELPTRSTTATRLSQRLVLSLTATHNFDIRSWDVSGAFLKGFSFAKVKAVLQSKGISSPKRSVVIIPPANVWRHLASMDASFGIGEGQQGLWGLECNKPAYGLNDAPLAWQLCLHESLEISGGTQSLLDENLWFWKAGGQLQAVMTTHVDDIAVCGNSEFLEKEYAFLSGRFGKISVQQPPFNHCGSRYNKIGSSFSIDHQEFIDNMKVMDFKDLGDDQSRPLTPAETSTLRSILGGLLWITATRLDLVADVGVLQSRVTKATVQDLHLANAIVKKAKMAQYRGVGIVYKHFPTTSPWRLVAVHDASSASKGKAYSQEGIMILLMQDNLNFNSQVHSITGLEVSEEHFGGAAHILFAHGAKAKRISYSTSHSETLAAISGLETASLVALRLAELLVPTEKPTLQQLAALQEAGVPFLPVDAMTDCKDFYSLTTGGSALPQDRSQRVYILAHREARLCGRLRWVILVPTQSMVADALTKPMLSKQLLHLLSTGCVEFRNESGHPLEARRLPPTTDFNEDDLETGDKKWIGNLMTMDEIKNLQGFSTSWTSSTPWTSRSSFWMMAALCTLQIRRGRAEGDTCDGRNSDEEQKFEFQKAVVYIISAMCMFLCLAVWYLWKCLRRMQMSMDDYQRQRIQPLLTASLVDRMLQAEHNIMEVQLQANETVEDINTIYRTLRRRASPHPDERSSSRPRVTDTRPVQPEPDAEADETRSHSQPEVERAFDETASRSRDDSPSGPNWSGEGEEEESGHFDGQLIDGDDLDEVPHDLDRHQMQEARLRNRLHIMTIEANNFEVHLQSLMLRRRRAATLLEVIDLYNRHAPSLDAPGAYEAEELLGTTTAPDGVHRFFLQERHPVHGDTELTFLSQSGLYQFRNLRLIYREDWRMTTGERASRLFTIYNGMSVVQ